MKLRVLSDSDWGRIPIGSKLYYRKTTPFIVTNNKCLNVREKVFGGDLVVSNRKIHCRKSLRYLYIEVKQ